MIVVTELFSHPSGECGRFVVDEKAAVLHGRLALHVTARADEKLIAMCHRHVSPPIPGRNADLLRHIIEAIDAASFVAADNEQSAFHPRPGPRDNLNQERFPTPANYRHIELRLAYELIDETVLSQRAYNNDVCRRRWCVENDNRPDLSYAFNVGLEVARGTEHTGVILRVDKDWRCNAVTSDSNRAGR